MKKYLVTANTIKGHTITYKYEGDGEYRGKFESVEDRIKRHFEDQRNIVSYTMELI